MRGYLCLSILLGGFAFLTIQYSFVLAFGVIYCIGLLVVIGTAFALGFRKRQRSRASVLADHPAYLTSKELIRAKNLHAA